MSKQAYQEKLEAQLAEWDARVDLIEAKAKGLQAEERVRRSTLAKAY